MTNDDEQCLEIAWVVAAVSHNLLGLHDTICDGDMDPIQAVVDGSKMLREEGSRLLRLAAEAEGVGA
jgi:hypothetical protein